jgi:aerobic-type carbon monoxide dehydrogenase small subunit (CoxS/CutS family)
MERPISFTLNGQTTRITVDADRMLLWVLRSDLGLTGTKCGCGEGLCGACTVVVDNRAVRACSTPVADVAGKHVLTIEGLARDGRLHPLQEAFARHGAFQCGFCTPGMILTAYALLVEKQRPSRAEIVAAMDDNLCRCGSHPRVLEAIEEAAAATGGGR